MMAAAILCLALSLSTQATALRLGKPASSTGLSSSSSQRFPEDIFAHPAFNVKFENTAVSNSTAERLLAARADGGEIVGWTQDSQATTDGLVEKHMLMKVSRQSHLCTLSLLTAENPSEPTDVTTFTPETLLDERHRVITSGLALLSPLRGTCLYHTLEWFTYSLCFGEAVRQFKAVDASVGPGRVPVQDPSKDAYVLGRWRRDLEMVAGKLWYQTGQESMVRHGHKGRQHSSVDPSREDDLEEASQTALMSSGKAGEISDEDEGNGTELMQIIRFASNGDEQRYLSQVWTDGTLCLINHEPRSIEIQYHCNLALTGSRIALIKETMTCSYVMIVETPLICQERQLRVGREGKKRSKPVAGEWRCSRIVDDVEMSANGISSGDVSAREAQRPPSETAQSVPESDGSSPGPKTSSASRDADDEAQDTPDANLHTTSSSPWLPTPDNPSLSSTQYFAMGVDEDGNIVVDGLDSWAADIIHQQDLLEEQQDLLTDLQGEQGAVAAEELLERLLARSMNILNGHATGSAESDAADADASGEGTTRLEAQLERLLAGREHGEGQGKADPESSTQGAVGDGQGQRLKASDSDKVRRQGSAALIRALAQELAQQRQDLTAQQTAASMPDDAGQPRNGAPQRAEHSTQGDRGAQGNAGDDKVFAELNRDARLRAWAPRPVGKEQAQDPKKPKEERAASRKGEAAQQPEPPSLAERVEAFYRGRDRVLEQREGRRARDEL
ncbi:unnamed protein product [Parajaminaea phylloscopi]